METLTILLDLDDAQAAGIDHALEQHNDTLPPRRPKLTPEQYLAHVLRRAAESWQQDKLRRQEDDPKNRALYRKLLQLPPERFAAAKAAIEAKPPL